MFITYAGEEYEVNLVNHGSPVDGDINVWHIYPKATGVVRKNLKRKYREAEMATAQYQYNSLAAIPCCTPMVMTVGGYAQKQENKEPTMAYEFNQETEQRNYMKRRLDGVKADKYDGLSETYHLGSPQLKSKTEILAAIAAGNIQWEDYCFNQDGTVRPGYYVGAGLFTITDPLKDQKGYDAAYALLQKKYQEAKDAIIVKPLADGLAALQAFEAQTF